MSQCPKEAESLENCLMDEVHGLRPVFHIAPDSLLFVIACRQERIASALERIADELSGIRCGVGALER